MGRVFVKAVWVLGACAVLFPLTAGAADQDAIDYRQHIMKTLDAQFNAVALVVTAGAPAANLASHLNVLLMTARTALKAFEPKAPGGEALPVVWERWDDFSAKMKDFEATVAAAAESAKSGNPTLVLPELEHVNCKKCHDVYRKK